MYYETQFRYAALASVMFVIFYIVNVGCPTFCEIAIRHKRSHDNVTRLFSIISGLSRFQNKLAVADSDLKKLPKMTLYINKLYLMEGSQHMSLKNDEILSFSLLFLEDLFHFHNSELEVSGRFVSEFIDSKLHTLMSFIIRETVPAPQLTYSVKSLVRCLQATPIAQYSVMGSLGISERFIQAWKQLLQSSINRYVVFKMSLSKAREWRRQTPNFACRKALHRMAQGCSPTTNHMMGICVPYCMNVLLGCLAPQLLPAPTAPVRRGESYQAVWNQVLPSSGGETDPMSAFFNLFFSSVNASNILQIIRDGLANAQVNREVLAQNVKTICDATLSSRHLKGAETSSVLQDSPAPTDGISSQKEPEDNRMRTTDDDQRQYWRELHKLSDFVHRLRSRLVRLAEEQLNVKRLSDIALRRFCHLKVAGDSTECWTGEKWARPSDYKKPVPEFSTAAQQNNPEVPFIVEEATMTPTTSQSSVNTVYGEGAVSEDSKEKPETVDVYQTLPSDDYASSGFLHFPQEAPVPLPYDFLGPISPNPAFGVNQPSSVPEDLWPELPPLEYVDCPPDDEDCIQSPGAPSGRRNSVQAPGGGQISLSSDVLSDVTTPTIPPADESTAASDDLQEVPAFSNPTQTTQASTTNTTVAKPKGCQSSTKPSFVLPFVTCIVLLIQLNAHHLLYFNPINIF